MYLCKLCHFLLTTVTKLTVAAENDNSTKSATGDSPEAITLPLALKIFLIVLSPPFCIKSTLLEKCTH